MRIKKYAGVVTSIACVIIIAEIVGETAMEASYTVLSGDDFTHGVRGACSFPCSCRRFSLRSTISGFSSFGR